MLGAEWSNTSNLNTKYASINGFKGRRSSFTRWTSRHRADGQRGAARSFSNSATVSTMGFNSMMIGVVLRKVVLNSKLAGVSNRHRGEMYMGGIFLGFLILSSPGMIIPRDFNLFLARTTFSPGYPRKSCEHLRSLAKSREVPTVLQ